MADVTATQFQEDVNNFSEVTNGDISKTVTMRLGEQVDSVAKTINDIKIDASEEISKLSENFNLTPAFEFEDGFTIETRNQAGRYDDGLGNDDSVSYWIYNMSIPEGGYIVPAGTIPAEPDYKEVLLNVVNAENVNWSVYGETSESIASLRKDLNSAQGASIVLTNDNTTVQFEIDQIKSDKVDFWYTAGDGVAPDLVFDATNDLGLNVTGSDVDSIVNLGKISQGALLPTAATKSPIEVRSGFKTVKFDGSGIYDRYELTPSSFASGFFSATKKHFMASFYVNDNILIDSTPFSIGDTGSGAPRLGFKDGSNGITYQVEYQDGTTLNTIISKPLQRDNNEISSSATFHNGTDSVSLWVNGVLLGFNEPETGLALQNQMNGNAVSVGSTCSNIFPLNGGFISAAIDNNENLSIGSAYEKYKSAYLRFGGAPKQSIEIVNVGQSNAEGNFANPNPYNFSDGEAYYYQKTNSADGTGVFIRDGFGQSSAKIGESCPAIWFAAELKRLTGLTPLFQDLTFGGTPVSPGLPSYTEYQAPKNSVGDSAGQNSILETWKLDFERMKDLCNFSPEFNVVDKVAYLMGGEADANAIANLGSTLTKSEFKSWFNSWIDSLSSLYEIKKFAVVNIGRRGQNLSQVTANSFGVDLVREGISEVIAERSDCYDVFPHLNHIPDPFVLDDLVTSEDGAWISGQANNADGVHYTPEMYKAIAITAARNFYRAIS